MSEIVVYTTIAVVFSRHDDVEEEGDDDDRDSLQGGGVLWRPIAGGAWAKIHLFLEMERDLSSAREDSPRHQLMRNFRLIAWILESGKVIVNDVVSAKCMWAPIDELLWQFTSADGHCYGFRFHSMDQADECAQVMGGILNNVDEIRRLVKKMFQTRTTTRDFLSLLYDIGFFKLDSSRRSTMIESAHAAVAALQAQPEWPRPRSGVQPIYPKEAIAERPIGGTAACSSTSPDLIPGEISTDEAGIVRYCTGKRTSNHHLLAQFSEVQLAAMVATESKQCRETNETIDEDPESDSSEDSDEGECVAEPPDPKEPQEIPPELKSYTSSRRDESSQLSHSASSVREGLPKDCISLPYKTRQELHVTYNNEFARYEGLPRAWRRLNHQFGLPLEAVPKRDVLGYSGKIPSVLQMLREALSANGGLLAEGIFRVPPDKDECTAVKHSLNDGTFAGCNDVHIIANLIKVWFRELPQSLFNVVPEKHIYRTCDLKSPDDVVRSIDSFPPLHASLVLWLLDLMADVADNEKHNKMSARNMAIVISPNLFSIESDNPMYALTMSQKVAQFTHVMLDAWMRRRTR